MSVWEIEFKERVPFYQLIRSLARQFRSLHRVSDIVDSFPEGSVVDVSHLPQYRLLSTFGDPLPYGFEEHHLAFLEAADRGGSVEVVFKGEDLVNVRAQMIFRGFMPGRKAKSYYKNGLVTLAADIIKERLEPPAGYRMMGRAGPSLIFGLPERTGQPYVSAYIMEEEYTGSRFLSAAADASGSDVSG